MVLAQEDNKLDSWYWTLCFIKMEDVIISYYRVDNIICFILLKEKYEKYPLKTY